MDAADPVGVTPGELAGERLALALQLMDGAGLLARLVDGEHDAAVHQLLVDLDGGRGQEQHHRALDVAVLGDQASGVRVLAGRGDGEPALALQELEGVARALGAFLLGDGQDLVLELGGAHVKERLAGHRRVLDALLVRDQRQDRLHERRLAGGGRALDEDGERLVELARHGGQVAHQLVGLLADDAAALEVGEDALQEIGRLQQDERLGTLLVGHRDGVVLRLVHRTAALVDDLLQLVEDLAEVALDDGVVDAELDRGLLGEARAA